MRGTITSERENEVRVLYPDGRHTWVTREEYAAEQQAQREHREQREDRAPHVERMDVPAPRGRGRKR